MTSTHINGDGFRKVSTSTSKLSKSGNQTSLSITDKIVDGLTNGKTPRMIAVSLNLPLDFVDLVIEQECAAGRINVYDLRSCNTTTGEGCDPDPESLVCAGCPIFPKAIRKRQSVFGRLKAKLSK
ncbi:hypothetical protein OZX72_00170 [Bifidobacterium sp. ESL0769]|uniref:hypothetical protein n=1 Tax=Bifidobacterium sp. ESL0769 TaxID=2983229 RepID=UPI0023F6831B|nr:hypothetical protein [Bifidobacterium sp. ESL0769]WEV67471.1 hypothetical protein OZX72_00170 [Bifidobacterium sp. ESL0769]